MTTRRRFAGALIGGLAAGVLDLFAAVITYGVPFGAVARSIAGGVLGKAAHQGGASAAGLGVVLHLLISLAAAGVFAAAAARFPILTRRPLLSGPLFGIAMYGVMNYVIIPLSASPLSPPAGAQIVKGLLVHMFVFGLPIALAASWAARPAKAKA